MFIGYSKSLRIKIKLKLGSCKVFNAKPVCFVGFTKENIAMTNGCAHTI